VIPEELTQFIEAYDYEDLDMSLINVTFDTGGFRMDLELKTVNQAKGDNRLAAWRVEAVGHRENRITFDYGENIRIEDDHPLLWRYTDLQASLYYTGSCSEPEKLFYQIYQVHFSLFQTYIPVEIFLNMNEFVRQFQFAGGLVAEGPKKVLTRYAKCLADAGIEWSIINEHRPTHWDGAGRRPERTDLKILLIGQTNTFVIAEDFNFSPL
jgi:hypothetical protein